MVNLELCMIAHLIVKIYELSICGLGQMNKAGRESRDRNPTVNAYNWKKSHRHPSLY